MVVVADVARLIGLDQLHIGTIIGKMEGIKEEILTIEDEIEKKIIKEKSHYLAEDWHHIKPIFAVCSGGLHPALVPYLVETLGKDIIIQAGGGVHGHPLGTEAGARAMRQAIDAVMNHVSLKEYAKNYNELRLALNAWR
jgi:ribulose-bisphosphate carboxylase large chain